MAQKIMDKLRKIVDMAGVKKCRTVFRIPIHKATRLTKKMYGNIRRFKKTVRATFSGLTPYPGKIICTI
jgi:hypothetical protein